MEKDVSYYGVKNGKVASWSTRDLASEKELELTRGGGKKGKKKKEKKRNNMFAR